MPTVICGSRSRYAIHLDHYSHTFRPSSPPWSGRSACHRRSMNVTQCQNFSPSRMSFTKLYHISPTPFSPRPRESQSPKVSRFRPPFRYYRWHRHILVSKGRIPSRFSSLLALDSWVITLTTRLYRTTECVHLYYIRCSCVAFQYFSFNMRYGDLV